MTLIPTCPACQEPLHTHAQCCGCRCLMHRNVMCRYDPAICNDCDRALFKRGARRCTIGGEIKPLDAFAKQRGSTKHYRACRACRDQRQAKRDANRRHYAAHADARRAYGRDYYDTHTDARKAASKRWRTLNHARSLAASANWRTNNREQHRANTRAWQARNPDAVRRSKRGAYQRRKLAVWFGK